MPNFPKVHNKAEFENYVTQLKNDVQSGKKWLNRDVTAVKKDHFLLRVIKRILNLFPGDRFAPIRADKAAHSLLDFCEDSQNRTYVDAKIADQLISVLDFLKDKTRYSKHSKAYVKEIEEDKQKIQALVTSSTELKHLFPEQKIVDPKEKEEKIESEKEIPSFVKGNQIIFDNGDQKDSSEKDQMLDHFEQHLEEIDTLKVNGAFNPEQAKRLSNLIERSNKLKKIEIPSALANSKDLSAVIAKKKELEVLYSPDEKATSSEGKKVKNEDGNKIPSFVKGNQVTFDSREKDNFPLVFDYLEQHLDEIENLKLDAVLMPEQGQRLSNLIQRLNKLKKIEAPFKEEENLIDAITQKKGIEVVQCLGTDRVLANLANDNPGIKELTLNNLFGEVISSQGISDLLKLSHLEKLFLEHPEFLFRENLKELSAFGSKLSSLEEMSIKGDSSILPLMAASIDQFQKVKCLKLIHCTDEILDNIESLSKVKSNITEISIEGEYGFRQEIKGRPDRFQNLCKALSDFNLRKLSLEDFRLNSADYSFLSELKTVEELALSFPDEGSAEAIEKLINQLPNLKKITITTHPQISFKSGTLASQQLRELQWKYSNVTISVRHFDIPYRAESEYDPSTKKKARLKVPHRGIND